MFWLNYKCGFCVKERAIFMKKLILSLLLGAILGSNIFVSADTPLILYFDKNLAVQKCEKGKSLQTSLEKRKVEVEKELKEKAQQVRAEGEAFEKQAQAGLLKEGVFIKKRTDLAKKMRALERLRVAKEEDLEADLKTEVGLLSLELEDEAGKIFKQKKAKVRVGPENVAEVTPDIDITNEVIEAHNKSYGGEKKV